MFNKMKKTKFEHYYYDGHFVLNKEKRNFEIEKLPDNRLYKLKDKPTKLKEEDLPNWFVKSCSGEINIYNDCSNIKSLDYKHIANNHIFKDAILIITYNDNENDHYNIYGKYVIDALKLIVKYNDIDLTNIKNEMIEHFTIVNKLYNNLISKDAKKFVEEIFNEIYKN